MPSGWRPEIGNGLDLAGRHFHDDAGAVFGVVIRKSLQQGVLSDVLDIHIQGGDDILSARGFDLITFHRDIGTSGDIADETFAALAFEQGVIGSAPGPDVLGRWLFLPVRWYGWPEQTKRIESFAIRLCDKAAALIPSLTDEWESCAAFYIGRKKGCSCKRK